MGNICCDGEPDNSNARNRENSSDEDSQKTELPGLVDIDNQDSLPIKGRLCFYF